MYLTHCDIASDVYQVAYIDDKPVVIDGHVPYDEYNVYNDEIQDVFDIEGSFSESGGDLISSGPVLRVAFSRPLAASSEDDFDITPENIPYLIWAIRTVDSNFAQNHDLYPQNVMSVDLFEEYGFRLLLRCVLTMMPR